VMHDDLLLPRNGSPEHLDEEIHLCSYDPEWPRLFLREAARIKAALSSDTTVEHIGSTSVPGLLAKPVIDIMVGLQQLEKVSAVRVQLASLGYTDLGEAGVPGRWYFRRRAESDFNVHATLQNGPIWNANLALRDYLRANPEACAEYTNAKLAAWENGCKTLLSYSDHKSETVHRLVRSALTGNS
jgi:GrpB-like predicted nucleotidyltransferase (UPF0157 family)